MLQRCILAILAILLAGHVSIAQDKNIETGIEDDLTVKGTNGTAADADLEVNGFSVFGPGGSAALSVTNQPGSVFMGRHLEINSNLYVMGRVAVGWTNPSALLNIGTNSFQVNTSGDVVRLRNIPYSWPTNQGATNTYLLNDGNGKLSWNRVQMNVCLHAPSAAGNWANMPAALTEFRNVAAAPTRSKADLSGFTQARVVVRLSTVGAAAAEIRGQYSTDEVAWSYLDGASGPGASLAAVGTIASAWVDLEDNAKADVFLRIIGINGNGNADPVFGAVSLQFR